MTQHGHRSKRWFSVLCILLALFVVMTARGDLWAASTSSSHYGLVVANQNYYAYAPTIINDNGLYHMWYGGDWNNTWGDRILHRTSSNGTNWGNASLAIAPSTAAGDPDCYSNNDPTVVIKTSVAPRSSAAASCYHSASWVPAKAIDGSAATCWSTVYHATAVGTEWLELSFGSTIGVNAIQLTPRSGGQCFPVDFKLQYYDGSWHDIAGQSYTNYTNPGGTEQEFTFPTVKGSKIRVYATKLGVDSNGNHYCQMAEINATQAKFYLYYTAQLTFVAYNQIYLATSDDGISWTKHTSGGNVAPVLPIRNFYMHELALFEDGVDANWSFYRGRTYNPAGHPDAMNYAWNTPYDSQAAHDDMNYWDTWDDGDGVMGYLDAQFNVPAGERDWSNHNYLQTRLSAITNLGSAGQVAIFIRNSGVYQYLGTHTLDTSKPKYMMEIDISGYSRSNVDQILFRVLETYFSDLNTTANYQRMYMYNLQLCSHPQSYGVGMGSVFIKDGYFWQFFSDYSYTAIGLYLARSTDGISWTMQNSGNRVYTEISCDVKYLPDSNKYYMVYGNLNPQIWWNISSSMTSWPAHSAYRTLNVNTTVAENHNPGLLSDSQGHMAASGGTVSTKCYYGSGYHDSGTTMCDIHMSNLTITP